jgi:hypothetical protein
MALLSVVLRSALSYHDADGDGDGDADAQTLVRAEELDPAQIAGELKGRG